MNQPVNITFNIKAADAASFRRSQQQLMSHAVRTVARRRAMDGAVRAVIRDPELFAKAPPPFDWGKVRKAWKMVKAVLAGKDSWK